jgi:hypothetical protein
MLEFRPHHFLCTIGFQGKGYSAEFVKNYAEISTRLKGPGFEAGYTETPTGDLIKIRVVAETDSICAPCPSKRGALCETQEKIDRLDHAHAEILGLKTGDELTWGEAKKLLAQKFTLEKFDTACQPCSWKSLGVCETALIELKKAHSEALS